jgi:SAM-dependent methyltransferase
MTSVEELYELWANEHAGLPTELARSLDPRGTKSLYGIFRELGVGTTDVILDAGARDAVHAIELVRLTGCRAVAVDPVPLHIDKARRRVADAELEDRIEVVEGSLEALPCADASFDFIWCRDVLNHVELGPSLRECHRVLRPSGSMLAYQTFATDMLEPKEAERLFAGSASRAENMSPDFFEQTAREVGFDVVSRDELRGEWRERMLEDGTWNAVADLLALSRLRRREGELIEQFGCTAVEAEFAGLVWGVYQILGKTSPTIYVLSRGD